MQATSITRAALAVVLLAALLAAAASGCRAEEEPLVLSAPWDDGEVSRLEVLAADTGTEIAGWVITMAAAPDGGWVITTEMSAPGMTEVSSVHVRAADLLPLSIDYELESAQAQATYTGLYGEEDLVITATVNGEAQSPTVKLPEPPYFDNEQVVPTLRAMPLAEGWETALNIVGSKSATKGRITVKVAGREEVTVPAGTFDCWKVELVGMEQAAWISVDPPHQLVRYENTRAKTLSRLVDYLPGQ